MNVFLKNFGIILIILGVGILAFYTVSNPVSNTPLVFAGLLMIGGIAAHIILNKIIN